jgi:outer membrane lipoprotein-sorting protein
MKSIKILCLYVLIPVVLSFAQTGTEILEEVDDNTVVTSWNYRAKMTISLGGTIREKEFTGYAIGKESAYMEFTSPARDKGTRFLKLGDEMWMYIPAVERATKIAGHMLRQSMMGSDFSYDDVVENRRLIELYHAELETTEEIDGKECYVLQLTAKIPDINYYSRKMWVDKDIRAAVKVELYAKSGKLLKEVITSEFISISGYTFPTKIKMANKLRRDTYTELELEDVSLDIQIPDRIFTKAYLERK